MTSLVTKLLLKMGLVEEVNMAPVSMEPVQEVEDDFVVLAGETVTGGIDTHRNVEIRGKVHGSVYTPNGRVVLTSEGAISGGTICAKEMVWEGAMGGSVVHCSHISIIAGAKSIPDTEAPHLFHESMTIGKIGALDVSFDRQAYLPRSPVDKGVDAERVLDVTKQDFLAAA